jgi:hypothetical protein
MPLLYALVLLNTTISCRQVLTKVLSLNPGAKHRVEVTPFLYSIQVQLPDSTLKTDWIPFVRAETSRNVL